MRITLEHTEIEAALVNYVSTQGIDISDKDITVEMTAGRGSNGYSASITLAEKAESKDNGLSLINPEDKTEEEPADSTGLFAG